MLLSPSPLVGWGDGGLGLVSSRWWGPPFLDSTIGPASADRSEGLPIENHKFPIENPVVVVESGDFRWFLDYFWIFGPQMK